MTNACNSWSKPNTIQCHLLAGLWSAGNQPFILPFQVSIKKCVANWNAESKTNFSLPKLANPKNANEVSFDTQQRLLEQQKQEEEELRQKARKSPFSNFYQVNIDESPALRKCLDENPKALKLLFF